LLSYCAREGHWSIFEMASMCLEIETSRTIARQILRHRSFSFQEFSQRYADVTSMKASMIQNKARSQDPKNRQASIDNWSKKSQDSWHLIQKRVYENALDAYDEAISKGMAKECARAILPEGLTPSRMYMSGTVRSWIHYLKVRLGNGTQAEHVEIAESVLKIFNEEFPTISTALFNK